METMYAETTLINENLMFKNKINNKEEFIVDYIPPLGNGEGYTSLELFLISLLTCCCSTVKILLDKQFKIKIRKFHGTAKAVRKDEHPTCFSQIDILLQISADALNDEMMKKAVSLSENKFCPVIAMMNKNIQCNISWNISHE